MAAFALGLMGASGGAKSAITPAAMSKWAIVCDVRATPAERYAAEEFQTLFRGLTGETLPIVERAPGSAGVVLIGPDAVERAGVAMPAADLDEEGLRIRVDESAVAIDGGRPRGTLYGVYEFFEELCGVRYLTHDHTYYPPNGKRIRIPLGSRSYVPQFKFRWPYYGETSHYPEFAARLRANTISDDPKLGGKTGYVLVNHCVAYLVPPSVYGKEHPEYYALVKGKRDWQYTDGGGPQLCLTNPHVVDIVVNAIEEQIRTHPGQRNFNIAQMDNDRFCTCPKCAALDEQEGSHSATMIAFVNAVAERIEKRYPDALLSTFAYWYTRKPPRTLKPRRNVMIQLCSIECCDLHAIDDPKCTLNREFCHDMQVWNSKCDKIFVWHYNTNFSAYMLPFPNLKAIGPSVKYFADRSGRGVFMQAAGNAFSTELSDLRNYVMARCLWKPGRDSWKEAEEFCKLHYAESAGPILAYLRYYHDLVNRSGMHPTCFATVAELRLTPDTVQHIMAYFASAVSLARSTEVRDRVEKASLCAYRAALIGGVEWRNSFRDGMFHSDPISIEHGSPVSYGSLCAKFGVTMERETESQEEFMASQAASGSKPTSWPAVKIENEVWRVVAIPESNGKIVEMTYKPTGRNIVEARRPFNRFRFEDWVTDGEGPAPKTILPFTVVKATPTEVVLSAPAADGTRFERSVSLAGDAVRFDTKITAGVARSLAIWVHPEYDLPTQATDPRVLSAYVRVDGKWAWANRGWLVQNPNPEQEATMKRGLAGGVIAFFNRRDGFGVEQRFNPSEFQEAAFRPWTSRGHVNLELTPRAVSLHAGETAHYGYEVRYLTAPPTYGREKHN
jgi:hypothetical protein